MKSPTCSKKTPRNVAKAKRLYWIDGLSFAAVAQKLLGSAKAAMTIRRWIGPGERNRRGWNASKRKDARLKRRAVQLRLVRGLSFRKVARMLRTSPATVAFLVGRPFSSRMKSKHKEY
jgi:DNA-binding NarL/FixJ family response regulator